MTITPDRIVANMNSLTANLIATQNQNRELREALGNVLTLARLKWGNLDTDANKVFEKAEALL
jgi:hypothetical protein